MAKLKFKNPKTGAWEEVGSSLQSLKDGEKASLYMDNTNEVTTPAGGTTLHPNPISSTTAPTATGTGSFAIGSGTKATGDVSVAEGILNEASGKASHAEGAGTKAGGNTSHAEGFYTEATGDYSHAENYGTIAQGKKSHAEGSQTIAIGNYSHAEGYDTIADGEASHAGGYANETHADFSTVIGKYGEVIRKNDTRLFVIGNGTSETNRSNAFEVYANGTGYLNKKKILVEGDAGGGSATIGNVTATATSIDSSKPATAIATTSGNNISFAFGIPKGPKGDKGDKGSDANVTTTNITAALGYTPADQSKFLPLSGGTLTGDLSGRYLTGELLRTTNAGHTTSRAEKVAVIDNSYGYIYYRTPEELMSDMGINNIKSVSADATTLSYYESATANVNFTNGNMHFTFGIPQGEPYENPCLIEGTQITMADNTTKSVEDLKPGDIILSYDPVKKVKTNAVVIDAYKTGEAKVFDVYSFENGKYLTVYGVHGFYANDLGYVKNIQDITKTNELIDEDLNTTYLIVKRKMPLRDKPRSRYMIISSNNLYFANGILLGHSPWNKGQYCIKYGVEVPEAIREIYQSEINAYNGYDSFINTPEYHAEISEQYAKLANAVNEIKIYKDKLTATDYKVQKYTEGVLSEAEWQEAKAKRAAWRQAVNDNERLRDESRKLVDNIIKKYRKGVTMKQLFEDACIKDNATFEAVKNYLTAK